MKIFSLILVLIPSITVAQTLTISPRSVPLWGSTEGYVHFGVEFEDFGIHYFHSSYVEPHNEYAIENPISPKKNIGVSYTPIEFGLIELGIIAFPKQFPHLGAKKVNVWIEFNIPADNFSLRYIHISNAYRGDQNPGVDMFALSYSF